MKYRDIRKELKAAGWTIVRQKGSHEQWKHETKPGRVTVAGHDSAEIKSGTLAAIRKAAGL